MNSEKILRDIVIEGKHGKPVVADVFIPESEGPHPVIIFSHGFKGFKNWGPFNIIAAEFAKRSFIFVKINFAFNGTTPSTPEDFTDLNAFGENNFTKELDDLDVTINWIMENARQLSIDQNKISLIGHSRGGGISLI